MIQCVGTTQPPTSFSGQKKKDLPGSYIPTVVAAGVDQIMRPKPVKQNK
jgi:hypothetical protein